MNQRKGTPAKALDKLMAQQFALSFGLRPGRDKCYAFIWFYIGAKRGPASESFGSISRFHER
jgi:hypothetical protein